MADSNKTFVSPGVYTSEKDLTFVAQSIGVTTLGIVGETLKGPAFEPILVKDFDEFKSYFGPTSTEKNGNGNPKYELPYVAKSYLQESNQLFVTRVLGLTGHNAGKTYKISLLGGINFNLSNYTTVPTTLSATGFTGTTILTTGKTSIDGTNVVEYIKSKYVAGKWFTIGNVPSILTQSKNSSDKLTVSPIGDATGYTWFNEYNDFGNTGLTGNVYSFIVTYSTGGTMILITITYTGATVNKYNNLVVASLKSRGSYTLESLNYQVTGGSSVSISTNSVVNALSDFTLSATTTNNGTKIFTCSLDSTSPKFITKVLGVDVYDKNENLIPVFVDEIYPNFVNTLYERGLIRGLQNGTLTSYSHSESTTDSDDTSDFACSWDTPASPMIVSEVRGGEVSDLFQVITISDGNAGNKIVKVTISNINLETGEFDLLVRDFNDTDSNMSILEKYTRCSMNKELSGYVGLKVGTSDQEFKLNSKYIMLNMADNHPEDAIPSGFRGFVSKQINGKKYLGNVLYKTEYYNSGDIVKYSNGEGIQESGDNIKKVSLGISSTNGFDADLLKFKGKQNTFKSEGFHLSVNATGITGGTYSGYEFQTTPYDLEGLNKDKLNNINYRKFTLAVCGGYDGWDIYRKNRTNTDGYIFGKKTYLSSKRSNSGIFKNNVGNSDYYAYLNGIETFSNPESVDINVFATPGINYNDQSSLIAQSIDMVENSRADSLYIIDSPNLSTCIEVSNSLDNASIDSSYSATYSPWIQIKDTDNSSQIYVSPTGEVVRNIALTDNTSYPWFATAGYSRGLVKSIKALKKLTLEERDILYKNRINPIATYADTGTIIWGNKTLQVRESALDRINVRRLLLRARKLISAVSVRLLFDQDDKQIRQEFERLVNPILESIKKERGLYDFRVKVSDDVEDIDSNTLRGKIYLKPSRSLEFIDVEFVVSPTGASFENV